MKSIRCKLKSQTGASITYALLLFLVCAALSAVILVAATASAGRLSKLAETDQRYYSVTSAADLLTDLLDNQSVSVVKLTNDGGSTEVTRTFNKKMNEITDSDFSFEPTLAEETSAAPDNQDPNNATDPNNQTNTNTTTEAGDSTISLPENSNSFAASLAKAGAGDTFELSQGGTGDDPLKVTITVEEKSGSSALVSIQDTISTKGSGNKGHFKVYLKFSTNEVEGPPPVTKSISGYNVTGGTETTWNLVKMMTSYDK